MSIAYVHPIVSWSVVELEAQAASFGNIGWQVCSKSYLISDSCHQLFERWRRITWRNYHSGPAARGMLKPAAS